MSERDMEHMMMMMLHNAVTQVEMEEGSATTVSQNFKLWDLSLGLVFCNFLIQIRITIFQH